MMTSNDLTIEVKPSSHKKRKKDKYMCNYNVHNNYIISLIAIYPNKVEQSR